MSGFPENRVQALALIYVEKRATSETTPEEIAKLYMEARVKINNELHSSKIKE